MSGLAQNINILMNEWSENHYSKRLRNFISDGAVNADVYEKSSPKICFFLKEAYSKNDNGDWCLTDWLNNGALTRMWSAVAEWTYGIRNTTTTNICPKPHLASQEKTDLLKSIAVVNIKKSNGNVKSDYADLLDYAKTDLKFLKRELDILKPDVIVCGNNSSLLRLIYGAKIQDENRISSGGLIDADFMRKNGFAFIDSQIIIDYYHPANQYPSVLNYYTICGLYQQALKRKV